MIALPCSSFEARCRKPLWTSVDIASFVAMTLTSSVRGAQGAGMAKIIHLGVHLEFALTLSEIAFHPKWLPLGGAHTSQIALCLGLSVLVCIFWEMAVDLLGTTRAGWRQEVAAPRPCVPSFDSRDRGRTGTFSFIERRNAVDRRSCARGGRRTSDRALK